VTERIASAPAEERPKSSDENTGSALQNGTLLAASISLMKEENWERKLFCLLTSALLNNHYAAFFLSVSS